MLGGEDCGYFDSYSTSPSGLTAVVLSPSNNHVGQAARLSSGAQLRKLYVGTGTLTVRPSAARLTQGESRSVVFGYGYFFRQNSLCAVGFESPRSQALAVTACSLTHNFATTV